MRVKLTTLMLILAILQVSAASYAQRVTLSEKNAQLETVFNKIRKQTGYDFMFSSSAIKGTKPVSIQVVDADLEKVLELLFRDQPLNFKIEDRAVIVSKKRLTENATFTTIQPASIISGKIVDEKGEPMVGVTVTVVPANPDTKPLAYTNNNKDGNFTVNAEQQDKLRFSYMGFITQEHTVSSLKTPILIKMVSAIGSLDEVQVIAYGTTSRRLNTGTVSSVTADDIAKQPVANPLLALQGRVAGAVITQNSGLPGGHVDILIRGASSISSGTTPLYVIDGVPFNAGAPASVNGAGFNEVNGIAAPSGRLSPFSIINPDDIERIDILKDADATAIFGTKGANGAVMITTKRAKQGKTQLSLNLQQGVGDVARFVPVLSLAQYLDMRRQALKNDGITPSPTNAPDLFTWSQTEGTDWQRIYMGETAQYTNINATIQGGDARTRMLLSTGYNRETPVSPGNQANQRATIRLNVEHSSLDKKFNALANVTYGYNNSNMLRGDYSQFTFMAPNKPIYGPTGAFDWSASSNPEASLMERYIGTTNSLTSSLNLRYTIAKGLELQLNSGYNKSNTNQNQQSPAASQNPRYGVATNNANFGIIDNEFYSVEPQINYKRKIANGDLSVLIGTTFQNTAHLSTAINGAQYINTQLLGAIAGAASYRISGANTRYKYNSLFTRLNYNFQDKYIINGIVRRDGSSRFGADYSFGNFGSIGGAWIFSNESFLKDKKSILSFGKLKANWGLTGNDLIADYLYSPLFRAAGMYHGQTTLRSNNPANEAIRWETTQKLDIGVDLGFFQDRVLLNANYYYNRSNNQLGSLTLPISTGYTGYMDNFPARIDMYGWEFELNATTIKKKNFSWKSSINLTIPRNEIVSVSPDFVGAATLPVGYPLSQIRGYVFHSIDSQTGEPLFSTAAGGTTLVPTMDDLQWFGNTLPIAYGGIGNDFQYKGFSLSFFLEVMHKDGYTIPRTASFGLFGFNMPEFFSSGDWRQPGDIASIPKATTRQSVSYLGNSNYGFGDNTYAKLRNVSIAYALPTRWTKNIHITNARVFANAQNVYTWTKAKHLYDPETGVSTPPLRVITMGLSLSL